MARSRSGMPRSIQVGVPSGWMRSILIVFSSVLSSSPVGTLAGGTDKTGPPVDRPAGRGSARLQHREDVAGRVLEPGDRRALVAHDAPGVRARVPLEGDPAR